MCEEQISLVVALQVFHKLTEKEYDARHEDGSNKRVEDSAGHTCPGWLWVETVRMMIFSTRICGDSSISK